MSTTVQTTHYRIEEREVAGGQIIALHILGHVHETHRHHYGPHGLRWLVLLGGAR